MQAAASPKVAEPPFDGQNYGADIILRTSDAVDFYVHKAILSIASTYFKDLFAIPQPNDATDDHPKSLDAIPVSEDSQTIDYILRLCHYPVDEPVTAGLKGVTAALSAAIKYDLKRALRELKGSLTAMTDAEPLKVYAVSCKLGLDNEAEAAAIMWQGKASTLFNPASTACTSCCRGSGNCTCPFDNSFMRTIAGGSYDAEAFKVMSAGAYFRLLRNLLKNTEHFAGASSEQGTEGDEDDDRRASPPCGLLFNRGDADLVVTSCEGTEFRVHSLFLSIASAQGLINRKKDKGEGEHPVVETDVDAWTLYRVLRLCYPLYDVEINSDTCGVSQAVRIVDVATRYQIPLVALAAKKILREHIDTYPLQVYFLASQYGWDDLADEAVNECITLPSLTSHDSYTRHMEDATAESYYSLLKEYHSATFPHPSYRPQATVGKKQKKKGKRK